MQRKLSQFLIVVIALFLAGCVSGAPSGEESFIRELYKAVGRTIDESTDICTAGGVSCDTSSGSTVYSVDLSSAGVKATYLPNVDDDNLAIRKIDLSQNEGIAARLPDSWAKLSLLEEINVGHTAVYGSIPSAWKGMTSLKVAKLNNAGLCYSMPDWAFGAMPNLETADFSNNQLYYLADSWGTFSASTVFTSLNIGGNKFCNCRPESWTSSVLQSASSAYGSGCRANCKGSGDCRAKGDAAPAAAAARYVLAAVLATAAVLYVA